MAAVVLAVMVLVFALMVLAAVVLVLALMVLAAVGLATVILGRDKYLLFARMGRYITLGTQFY